MVWPSPPASKGRHAVGWLMKAFLALCVIGTLVACGRSDSSPAASRAQQGVLRILISTDLADIQPLAERIRRATGVGVEFAFADPLESTEAVWAGRSQADVAWFANTHLLLTESAGTSRVKHSESIVSSPLAVGLSQTVARALGWDDPAVASSIGWAAITRAAATGQLTFAMGDPITSDAGLMALAGVAMAANTGQDPGAAATPINRLALADFLVGYSLTGRDPRALTDPFVARQGREVNAFIGDEASLLTLNHSGKLKEPLVLIYPREGLPASDYPFMLLDESRNDDYLKVLTFLKSPEAQAWLARQTWRRPVHPQITAQMLEHFPPLSPGVEPPLQAERALFDALIDTYLDEFRLPRATMLLIDPRPSQESRYRQELLKSLQAVAGEDHSLTGRLARITHRDRLWLKSLQGPWGPGPVFDMPPASDPQVLELTQEVFKDNVADLLAPPPEGSPETAAKGRPSQQPASSESLLGALNKLKSEQARKPLYNYSVVILTDSPDLAADAGEALQKAYAQWPAGSRKIPVFIVHWSDPTPGQWTQLAEISGGKVFTVRHTSVLQAFKEIRNHPVAVAH